MTESAMGWKLNVGGTRFIALAIGPLTLIITGCSTMMHDDSVSNVQRNGSGTRRVEIMRPPSDPPLVAVSHIDGADKTEGKLFMADWEDITPGVSKRPSEVIEWPAPINRPPGMVFEMKVDAEPYWIHTMVYASIDPVSGIPTDLNTGEPTQSPIYEHQCRRAEGEQQCPVAIDGVIQIDSLPVVPGASEYVMLFAAWDVPPTDDEIAAGIQDWTRRASATWMFNFQNR